MIILITGATHTGKTSLALKMIRKYGCLGVSIDHLKMGLIRSGNTALTPLDDEELTGYLWPIVREMIKTAIENRQDLIVEGCYVPFDWRRGFSAEALSEIRFICLAMSGDYIDAQFDKIVSHSCDAEVRLDDSDLTPELLKEENRRTLEGFSRCGEKMILIEEGYEAAMDALLSRGEDA